MVSWVDIHSQLSEMVFDITWNVVTSRIEATYSNTTNSSVSINVSSSGLTENETVRTSVSGKTDISSNEAYKQFHKTKILVQIFHFLMINGQDCDHHNRPL